MQGKSLVMLLVVLYASAFLAGFNENLVNMALMSIMGEYGVDSVAVQWLVTGIMSTAQAGALAAGAGEALATAQGFSIAMVVAACIAAAGCALALVYSRAAVKRDAKRAGSM